MFYKTTRKLEVSGTIVFRNAHPEYIDEDFKVLLDNRDITFELDDGDRKCLETDLFVEFKKQYDEEGER